jgi:hypothetical protein
MKWQKLGRIFDPTNHKLNFSCISFAQSPQTLVFDDFVRVYFSTRVGDQFGKFLSQIAYVDFDKSFNNIIANSSHQVIALGKLGAFDEHGIFPINPIRVNDKILAYTCGWSRRDSVSIETSTGLAISFDNGKTFVKENVGPVLTSSLKEPMLVGDSFVLYENERYHMWYIFGKRWITTQVNNQPERVYKIAYAHSLNGIDWVKQEGVQIISDILGDDECQALPTVIKIGDTYHMYFCYRQAIDFRTNPDRGYRLGYAFSTDLMHWKRADEQKGIDVSSDGWDSEMICYPHIFRVDNQVYLLYNGNQFGKYGFGLAKLIHS